MALTIRPLAPAEIATLIDWAAGEGWNPGLNDAEAFQAADPDGFLGAFVDDEMVAGISAVAYGAAFGFIGLYIGRPDKRGKGYGKAVWDAGMARLAGRTIGLDGVPQQQANYRSMGFEPVYRTIRFNGRPRVGTVSNSAQPITSELTAAIETFDRSFFPAPRPAFLQAWLKPPHLALACLKDGIVSGYGVARACRDGFKIGPLFAQDQDTACSLFGTLARACDGEIAIDVPETAPSFIAFLAEAGLAPGFETARMYRGAPPALAQAGVFGITTLELG